MKKTPKRRTHQEMLSSKTNFERVTVNRVQDAQYHMTLLLGKAKKGMTVFMVQYIGSQNTFNETLSKFEPKPKILYDVILSNNASILLEYQNTTFTLMQKRFKFE